jgi:outer membrane protein OmpA-like peptidoglycan-associated protein
MRGKVLWLGLAALGVADWLVLNLAAGPAYLASQSEEAPPATASPVVPVAPPEAVAMALPPSTPQPPAPPPSEESPSPEPAEPETPPAPTVEAPEAPSLPPTVTPPAAQPLANAAPLEPLLFGRQSAELSDNDRKTLHRLAKQLRKDPGASVLIEGHADARGAEQFNEWLSLQRARAVRAYLQGLGVKPDQMQVASHGSSHPADGTGTDTAHAKNRRVELTFRSAQ